MRGMGADFRNFLPARRARSIRATHENTKGAASASARYQFIFFWVFPAYTFRCMDRPNLSCSCTCLQCSWRLCTIRFCHNRGNHTWPLVNSNPPAASEWPMPLETFARSTKQRGGYSQAKDRSATFAWGAPYHQIGGEAWLPR